MVKGVASLYSSSFLSLYNSLFLSNNGDNGGAIAINNSTATINITIFSNNDASSGGAIFALESSLSISHSSFSFNNASFKGAGVFVLKCNEVNFNFVSLLHNSGLDGRIASQVSKLIIQNSNISSNNGGAINSYNSNYFISNSYFESNSAPYGGLNFDTGYVEMINNQIINNIATLDTFVSGGGITLNHITLSCNNVSFSNNGAHTGGGLFASNPNLILSDSLFWRINIHFEYNNGINKSRLY